MKPVKNRKRVSWASGAKLCQVKLFYSEDCPSKVGLQAQNRLQAKRWTPSSNKDHSRFKGRYSMGTPKDKLSRIPQIQWKYPPKLKLSSNWHVAAGEASKEAETQKHREMRELEAIYPRLSDIPPNPSLQLDVQEDHLDDIHIPCVPITPIEEEGGEDLPSDMEAPQNVSFNSESEGGEDLPSDTAAPQNDSFDSESLALPRGLASGNPIAPECIPQTSLISSTNDNPAAEVLSGFDTDVVVAVVAAVTAIKKSKEQGSLIDTDLLIKFLSDPKMIEKLIKEQGASANTKTEPICGAMPLTASVPLPCNKPGPSEEVFNEDGPLTKTGNSSISGPNPVTSLVAVSDPKSDRVIEKLTSELGAAAKVEAAPLSGPKCATPSVVLLGQKLDPLIERLIQKHRAPTDTGPAPLSGSELAKPSVALPSPKPDPVIEKMIQKHRSPADTETALISEPKLAAPSVALPSTKPDPEIERLIQKYRAPIDTGVALISGSNLVTPSVALPCTKPDPEIERLIQKYRAPIDTGVAPISGSNLVTPSVAISSTKFDPEIERLIQKYRAPAGTEVAPISGSNLVTLSVAISSPKSDPVIENLIHKHRGPTDTGVAPLSRSKPVTSRVAFPSPRSVPVVKMSIHEHGVPTDAGSVPLSLGKLTTPRSSLPSSTPSMVEIKRMINEYGTPDGIGNESISRSMPLSLQVPVSNPKPDVVFPARMNSYSLQNVGETGIELESLSPDSAWPTLNNLKNAMELDFQMEALSPDRGRLNLHSLANVKKALSPDSVPISSFLAKTAPPAKDINYIKSLIRQHGDMQETQDYNLSQYRNFDVHLQDSKLVPHLKANELMPKVRILQKPCIYFNSPKGCRNGSNCLYRHDMPKKLQPGSVLDAPYAKRMKLDREIT
ncbi:Zinc finger CCCH domain-containing protein [Actinidia chinensis var. chinensis]|uniref:Zinc finger CCCH domain-containing protein n=1 Tax=Actinidia chinensis var. chinensis TaxID=1590841 RepID=A0A2R6Q285_ACTCC|nr:Zinc finger CCCH domain-containing protein [Actinidia chinensis var. chinensis]